MAQVLILATLSTKAEEADYLALKLAEAGVSARAIDISPQTDGKMLTGDAKCLAMAEAANRVLAEVREATAAEAEVITAIGGGTGGEIALQVMRALPITFPKILTTTLPFDPRYAIADNAIAIVPTLADVSGLNAMLRVALENTAFMAAGICQKARKGELTEVTPSVAITALGVTEDAVSPLTRALADQARETTVFHANGFGGAAYARMAERGAFDAIIDLTPHEVTRLHLAGAHVPMPARFTAGGHLPRVVLPGAMNFIGLGQKSLIPEQYLARPHYEHSGFFTHVKLTPEEMEQVSLILAQDLNALSGPVEVILPMGGFSHHDRPGGAIEDRALREVCKETLARAFKGPLTVMEAHISAPEVTRAILVALKNLEAKGPAHA